MRWFMVDRLEECEAGVRAIAIKSFSRSELFFMDHFPGRPTVPGVLEIEMIGQTAALCVACLNPGSFGMLSHVRSARFLRPIVPGDQCRIHIEILKLRTQYMTTSGYIEVDGRRVGEAELMGAIIQNPATENLANPIIEDWKQRNGGTSEQRSVESCIAAGAR
jgi:3-hydroxyacyl-[acyl-carrier-protein] dehydratase